MRLPNSFLPPIRMVEILGQLYIFSMIFTTFFAYVRSHPIVSAKTAKELANAGGQIFQAVMANDHWKTMEDIKHKVVGVGNSPHYDKHLSSLKSTTGKILHNAHIH